MKTINAALNLRFESAIRSFGHPKNERLADKHSVLGYVYKVSQSDWFIAMFGSVTVDVFLVSDSVRPVRHDGSLYIYLRANRAPYSALYALLKLSHSLRPAGTRYEGPEACAILLFLVWKVMGDAAMSRLMSAFTRHKVSFRPLKSMNSIDGQLVHMKLTGRL
jgi:hypothetical protein